VGPRAGLDAVSKRKKSCHCFFRELNPCHPAHSVIPILTEQQLIQRHLSPDWQRLSGLTRASPHVIKDRSVALNIPLQSFVFIKP
jgi:hypothetical protein